MGQNLASGLLGKGRKQWQQIELNMYSPLHSSPPPMRKALS